MHSAWQHDPGCQNPVAAADAMAVAAVSSPAASQSVRSVSSTRFDPNSRAGRDGSADGNGERGGRAGGHGEGNDGNFGLQLGCERGTVAAAAAAPALNGLTPGNEPDSKQAAPGVFTMPHPTASPTAAVAMAAAAAVAVRSLSLPGAAPTCPVMAPPLPLRRRRPPWGLLKKWPGRICMDLDFDWNFVLGLRLGRGSCPGKLPGPQKGDTSAAAAAETLDSLDTTSTLAPCCVHHSAAPALPFPTAITTTATSVAQATTGLMETLDVRVMERLLRASRCSGGGRGSESGFDDCNSTLGERTAFAGGSGVGGRRQRQCLVWRQRSAASQARRRDCQKGYHCIGGDDEGEGEGVAAWAQANGLWTVLPARPGLGCSSTLLSGLVPFPPVCEGLLGAQDPVIPSGLSDGLAVGEMFPYNFQPIAFMPHSGVLNGGGITDHARYSGGFVNTGGVSGGLHGGSPICTECTLGTDGATSPPLHPLPLPQRHRAVHLGYHPQPETGPPGSNQEAAAAAAQRLVQALCPPQLRGGRDTAGPPPTGGHSGSRSGAVSSIWGFGGTLGVYGNMGFVQSLDNPLLEVTASAVVRRKRRWANCTNSAKSVYGRDSCSYRDHGVQWAGLWQGSRGPAAVWLPGVILGKDVQRSLANARGSASVIMNQQNTNI
ncbi:hypothetical protein VOLCADRAFT_93968 [Volvox carteri f. nagariensis]|uniref:Uncharacterized protein n=1 Tax=Volvox carteri f. nagariensis TaxID=3068 RepID=D8U3J9_VOLCA|nr:uncharacterized protein VOLCADRAFT_93968 [Volvox carteri f. nagariensis]EFJ45834.1 hypothetical protein VOLCADRAFT_93968 [Volvox carteri f. nagariensis]|eukprot:XP_002953235.1 hypothetical protein VOLCADRAFT_93968 [Volvox carteri f. nagariensis]